MTSDEEASPARRDVLSGAAALVVCGFMSSSQAADQTEAIRSVIERYADAWQRRDPAALALYHPQFTVHWFGKNPLSGTHVGAQQVRDALGELTRRTNRSLVKIVATLAGRERGAIIARESFGTGDARVEMDRVLIFTVAEGRLRECWVYDADPQLLDRYVTGELR
jgi:ketosteroid isomerase-like protein